LPSAGERMTGPNIFFALACINYAKETGDVAWLQAWMPRLRLVAAYLLSMLDGATALASVPGRSVSGLCLFVRRCRPPHRWYCRSDRSGAGPARVAAPSH
jgi:hypothetical protein